MRHADGGQWDVVVIGAGPAGASIARRLAAGGARVLLVDRQRFPRHKVCGGCLSARTLAILESIGLGGRVQALGAVPLRRLQLRGWGYSLDLPLPGGVSISRHAFDASLAEAAVEAGAVFRPGCHARIEGREPGTRRLFLSGTAGIDEVRAAVVVVAGGLGSAPSGDRSRGRGRARIGVSRMVAGGPTEYAPGVIHMAAGAGGYVGLVRLEDGGLNVAAALDRERVRETGPGPACAAILAQAGFPPIAAAGAEAWSGTPPLGARPRRVASERIFALGDAAAYAEPFTGEGIGWALRAALLLAPLVEESLRAGWSPSLAAAWERRFRLRIGAAQRSCRTLAWASRHPVVARCVLAAVAGWPSLGEPLVRRLQAVRAPLTRGATAAGR